jgi:hypothetical protein
VVESQFALPRDALLRATALVMGYGRTSHDIADRIGDVVDELIDSGANTRPAARLGSSSAYLCMPVRSSRASTVV